MEIESDWYNDILLDKIAQEHEIEDSVALDILYLDMLRTRIIAAAKANPSLRDFPVHNPDLEDMLDELENEDHY